MARIAMVGDDTGETCLFDGALSEEESSDNVTAGGRFVALFGVTDLEHGCNGVHTSQTDKRCFPSEGSPNIFVNGKPLHRENDSRSCLLHETITNLDNISVNVFCNE